MKRIMCWALGALIVAATLVACAKDAKSSNKEFVFGVYNFTLIDPADNYNGWGTLRYGVGETLYVLDDSLVPRPLLVMGRRLSEDNLTWTLTLRPNVRFHNGDDMDGDAVKASLERLIKKNTRAANDLKIASIKVDGLDVSVTTKEPNPTFLNALCDPYACIVDAAAEDAAVKDGKDFNQYPIATGPFRVVNYVQGERAELEAFDDYWDGEPASDHVVIKGISDVDTLSLAMQNREIDAAYGLQYTALPLFRDNPAFAITQAATTRVYMLFFNLKRPAMSDARFRKAICMLLDKDSYATTLMNGAGTPTKSAFPSTLPYGNDALFQNVPGYDPEGAKALLREAGFVSDNPKAEKTKISIITYSRAGLPEVSQALQAALNDAGLDASYELVDNAENYMKGGDFDICAYAIVTTPTGDPYQFLNITTGTGEGSNYGGYSNPEVDDWLNQLASEFRSDNRTRDARLIQQLILKDSSYSYLFHLNMSMVMKSGVEGLKQSPVDYYQITAKTKKGD